MFLHLRIAGTIHGGCPEVLRGGFKNRGLESYYASWTDVGGVGPGNRGRSRDGVLAGSFAKGVSYYPIIIL